MSIISVLVVLILAGAAIYVVNVLPIDATFKTIAKVVVIIAVVIWLLQGFAPGALTLR